MTGVFDKGLGDFQSVIVGANTFKHIVSHKNESAVGLEVSKFWIYFVEAYGKGDYFFTVLDEGESCNFAESSPTFSGPSSRYSTRNAVCSPAVLCVSYRSVKWIQFTPSSYFLFIGCFALFRVFLSVYFLFLSHFFRIFKIIGFHPHTFLCFVFRCGSLGFNFRQITPSGCASSALTVCCYSFGDMASQTRRSSKVPYQPKGFRFFPGYNCGMNRVSHDGFRPFVVRGGRVSPLLAPSLWQENKGKSNRTRM